MRIRISHATTYAYDQPPKGVTQVLRLSPRDHDGQHVITWRIELSEDCLLHQHEDAFGNIIHSFTAEGPFEDLTVTVEGEVDTQDTNGLVSGAIERFPPQLYLRDTSLTQADATISEFAYAIRAKAPGDNLALAHALLTGLNREMTFDTDPTHAATTATESFLLRRGVCQDITISLLPRRGHLAFLHATSEDTFVVPTASRPRMPGMPGRRRISKILDGSALTRRTEFARPIPMYGLQSASTISVPLLCAEHVSEEAARL